MQKGGRGRAFVGQNEDNWRGGGGRGFNWRIVYFCGGFLGFIQVTGARIDCREIFLWEIVIVEHDAHVLRREPLESLPASRVVLLVQDVGGSDGVFYCSWWFEGGACGE